MEKGYSLLDDRIVRDAAGDYVIAIPGARRVKVRDPKADDPKMV